MHDPPYSTRNSNSTTSTSDLQLLEEAVSHAYQLLFSAAITQLMVPKNATETQSDGEFSAQADGRVSDTLAAVICVRIYALIVEICLGIVSIFICALWLCYFRRSNKMTSDPGCISQVMVFVKHSDGLLRDFENCGGCSIHELQTKIEGCRFILEECTTSPSSGVKLDINGGTEKTDFDTEPERHTPPDDFVAVRPWELSIYAAIGSILLIGSAVAFIVYIYTLIKKATGKSIVVLEFYARGEVVQTFAITLYSFADMF